MPEASQRGVAGLADPKLSKKQGGLANVRSYCKFYLKRPFHLWDMVICSGGGRCPPCVDLFWCLNKPFCFKDPESFAEGADEDI